MTNIDFVKNLMANAGRQDANYRKRTRSLLLRGWLSPLSQSDDRLTREGFASDKGLSFYLMDEAEPDRPVVLRIESREDAYAMIELAARYINEVDALDAEPAFHYHSLEVDRLDSGPTSSIHVRFDNRDENYHGWPTTSRHMSLPYGVFKVIRAVMSRIPQ